MKTPEAVFVLSGLFLVGLAFVAVISIGVSGALGLGDSLLRDSVTPAIYGAFFFKLIQHQSGNA